MNKSPRNYPCKSAKNRKIFPVSDSEHLPSSKTGAFPTTCPVQLDASEQRLSGVAHFGCVDVSWWSACPILESAPPPRTHTFPTPPFPSASHECSNGPVAVSGPHRKLLVSCGRADPPHSITNNDQDTPAGAALSIV